MNGSKITEILNTTYINECIAIALDNNQEKIKAYTVFNNFPTVFDNFRITGGVLDVEDCDRVFSFAIVKNGNYYASFKVNAAEVLKHFRGRTEADRVISLKQWLDVHVYHLVEICLGAIELTELGTQGSQKDE